MGADMIVQYLTWDRKKKLNWGAGERYAKAENISDQELENATGEEPTEENKENFAETLKEKLANIEVAVRGNSREVTVIEIGHLNVLLTGGVSWGDSPSEIYDDISDVCNVPGLLKAVGFDQDLYDYKAMLMKVLKALKTSKLLPCLIHLDKKLDALLEKEFTRASPHTRKNKS